MSLNVGDTESTPLLRKVKSVEALRIEGLSRASPRFTFVPTRAPALAVANTGSPRTGRTLRIGAPYLAAPPTTREMLPLPPAQQSRRGRTTSPFFVGLTLAISVIGPGLLCIPYAFRSAGLVMALLLVLGTAATTAATAEMLLTVHVHTRCNSYDGMAAHLFGEKSSARRLVPWLNLLAIFGACTGYVRLVMSLLPYLGWVQLPSDGWWAAAAGPGLSRAACLATAALFALVVLPLCMLSNLSSLRYSSAAGFACSVLLVFAIVRECIVLGDSIWFHQFYREGVFWGNGIATAASLINFAFVMHLNVIPAFQSLRQSMLADHAISQKTGAQPSARRAGSNEARVEVAAFEQMQRIIRCVSAGCAVVYCVTGGVAYAIFGNNTSDNILINLPDSSLMRCARTALVLVAISAFPLMFAPLRATFNELLLEYLLPAACFRAGRCGACRRFWTDVAADDDEDDNEAAYWTRYHALSSSELLRRVEVLGLLACCFVVAAACPGIGIVFSLTGGTAVVGIVYVFPVAFFLRSTRFGPLRLHHPLWRPFGWFVACMSTAIGIWHTVVAILQIVTHNAGVSQR